MFSCICFAKDLDISLYFISPMPINRTGKHPPDASKPNWVRIGFNDGVE